MIRKWFGGLAVVLVASAFLTFSSCGRDQELVSIQIQPATETFGAANIPVPDDAGLNVQLRALGTYIHPPVTKDITSQVTWASNDTQMMTVDSAGVLTASGQTCGSTLVSATVNTGKSSGGISSSGSIVTGYMTGNVVCFTGSGGGVSLTVNFAGTGLGSINSNPSGLSCFSTATNCTGVFTSGTAIQLTAVPSGTFGGWSSGCDSVSSSGLVCTINSLTTPLTFTATFN